MGIHTPEKTEEVLKTLNEKCKIAFSDCSYKNDVLDSVCHSLNDSGTNIFVYIPNSDKADFSKEEFDKFIIEKGEYGDPQFAKEVKTIEEVIFYINTLVDNNFEEVKEDILYVLLGDDNIRSFEDKDYDEVSITASELFQFTTPVDRGKATEVLYMYSQMSGVRYLILDRKEYELIQ